MIKEKIRISDCDMVRRILSLGCGVATLVSNTLVLGQEIETQPSHLQNTTQPIDANQMLGILDTWIAILGILVTVLLGITAFNILNQYREAKKYKADLMTQVEKEIRQLKETYNLSDLKSPELILQAAQNLFDRDLEFIRQRMEELRSEIDRKDLELKATIESGDSTLRNSVDFILKTLSETPTRDSILQEVSQRYQPPANLQQIVLRHVLDAFLRLKNISDDERESISAVLTVNPETSRSEPK